MGLELLHSTRSPVLICILNLAHVFFFLMRCRHSVARMSFSSLEVDDVGRIEGTCYNCCSYLHELQGLLCFSKLVACTYLIRVSDMFNRIRSFLILNPLVFNGYNCLCNSICCDLSKHAI